MQEERISQLKGEFRRCRDNDDTCEYYFKQTQTHTHTLNRVGIMYKLLLL